MRFLHKEFDSIVRFIDAHSLNTFVLDTEGAKAPRKVGARFLLNYGIATQQYNGAAPTDYIVVTEAASVESKKALDAIREKETENRALSFILIGYNDGGVLSISSRYLPFHDEAQRADWWTIGK